MKPTDSRNLFHANTIKSKHQVELITPQESKRVNRAWKKFWKHRGYDRPFSVHSHLLGVFDLPKHNHSWNS
jgi:hypothetical protein